ncbi:hypothetical protein F5Y17DRAFT_412247 [Xylariaceae sp. FL0594]|nr:hypothetical protein F5Y17DRAFT_412247 [Xylariaceae sp. FL0594]
MSGNSTNYNQPTELPAPMPAELAGDEHFSPPHPLQAHPAGGVGPYGNGPAIHVAHHDEHAQSPPFTAQAPSPQPGGQGFYPPPPPGPPPSAGNEQQQYPPYQQHQQPQQPQQHQPYYPPPPPGPRPVTGSTNQDEQQYYPPPPPGPPPGQTSVGGHAWAGSEPPEYSSEAPPSYSDEFGGGTQFVPDQKPPVGLPPALPPRPVSSSGPSSASQAYFPPPPGSAAALPAQGSYSASASASAGTGQSSSPASGKQSGGFGQKLYQWGIKAGGPINKITNMLGSEAFWPTTMDKECDKAARILKSFCKDGFYSSNSQLQQQSAYPTPSPGDPKSPGPRGESKVLVKIPKSAVANAKGLAIFTTFRTGLHISGAGGSGVVVARLHDGSWSPPAGFLVHTLGAGFMIGLDIYDCVCVLNTQAAVDAFARRARVSLGGELAVVAGPVGAGGGLETALGGTGCNSKRPVSPSDGNGKQSGTTNTSEQQQQQKSKPVWSYMKSRGFYAGVQADGTVIIPRPDANAAFYGERDISVDRILKGQVQVQSNPTAHRSQGQGGGGKDKDKDGGLVMWPEGGRQLMEVLKAAEGKGADANVMNRLGGQPTPGDLASGAPPPASGAPEVGRY